MILSRRETHFYAAVALAGVLPIVFLAGLIWRPSIPIVANDLAPEEGQAIDELFTAANFVPGDPGASGNILASETLTVNGNTVLIETVKGTGIDLSLILKPTKPLPFSNILVYWTPGDTAPEIVGDDAVLLGQLSGASRRQFTVPPTVQGQAGHLLFYSRGQDMAIAAVPLPPTLFP